MTMDDDVTQDVNAPLEYPRLQFLPLVKGEYPRTQGLALIDALRAADIPVMAVREGDRPGSIDFVLPDGVLRQQAARMWDWAEITGRYLAPKSGDADGTKSIGDGTSDVAAALHLYSNTVQPATIVERTINARQTMQDDAEATDRKTADDAVIRAYEDLPVEMQSNFAKLIDYLALVEERRDTGGEERVAARLQQLMRAAPGILHAATS